MEKMNNKTKITCKPFYEYELEIGDIVVQMGKTWLARQIANLTYQGTGKWSHIGMVVKRFDNNGILRTYIQEAIAEGVVLTPIDGFLSKTKSWKIMRATELFSKSELQRDAQTYLGMPYAYTQIGLDFWALLGKKILGKKIYEFCQKDPFGVVCSEWPAKCYAEQGIYVKCKQDGQYIEPQYLAPNDYIDSYAFIEVAHG